MPPAGCPPAGACCAPCDELPRACAARPPGCPPTASARSRVTCNDERDAALARATQRCRRPGPAPLQMALPRPPASRACGQDLRDAAAAPPARGGAERDALAPATTRGHQRPRGPLSRPVDDSSGVRWRPVALARIARRLSQRPLAGPSGTRSTDSSGVRLASTSIRDAVRPSPGAARRREGHGRRRLALGTSHGAGGDEGDVAGLGGCDPWPCKGCARLGADTAAESGLHAGAGACIASAEQDVRQGGAAGAPDLAVQSLGGRGGGTDTAARGLRAARRRWHVAPWTGGG